MTATRSLSTAAPAPRHVLLLQGLMGPLFRKLGQGLAKAGHQEWKVNFNGGDRFYWRSPGGIDFRGTLAEWPNALRGIISEHVSTDVMMFGDCRDYHMAAARVCLRQPRFALY